MPRFWNPRILHNPFLQTAGTGIIWYSVSLWHTDPIRNGEKNRHLLDSGPDGKTQFPYKGFAPKIFGWKPWFQHYTLREVEEVNHNTKRLRFDLPLDYAVSGLTPVCMIHELAAT